MQVRPNRCRFGPWVRKIPWRRARQPTPIFLPGECHGQRSLAGYSPQGHSQTRLKHLSMYTRCKGGIKVNLYLHRYAVFSVWLVQRTFLSILGCFHALLKIKWPCMCGFVLGFSTLFYWLGKKKKDQQVKTCQNLNRYFNLKFFFLGLLWWPSG